jgi:hypothetical protein
MWVGATDFNRHSSDSGPLPGHARSFGRLGQQQIAFHVGQDDRETDASGGARNRASERPAPIHPPGPSFLPRSISQKRGAVAAIFSIALGHPA